MKTLTFALLYETSFQCSFLVEEGKTAINVISMIMIICIHFKCSFQCASSSVEMKNNIHQSFFSDLFTSIFSPSSPSQVVWSSNARRCFRSFEWTSSWRWNWTSSKYDCWRHYELLDKAERLLDDFNFDHSNEFLKEIIITFVGESNFKSFALFCTGFPVLTVITSSPNSITLVQVQNYIKPSRVWKRNEQLLNIFSGVSWVCYNVNEFIFLYRNKGKMRQ